MYEFARPKGAKDKQQRKRRNLAIGLGLTSAVGLGATALALKNRKKKSFVGIKKTDTLPSDTVRSLKKRRNTNKINRRKALLNGQNNDILNAKFNDNGTSTTLAEPIGKVPKNQKEQNRNVRKLVRQRLEDRAYFSKNNNTTIEFARKKGSTDKKPRSKTPIGFRIINSLDKKGRAKRRSNWLKSSALGAAAIGTAGALLNKGRGISPLRGSLKNAAYGALLGSSANAIYSRSRQKRKF